jgi:DNA-binding ferritin-like protein (Dps family)
MPLSGNKLDRESYEEAATRAAAQPIGFQPTERAAYVRTMVNRVLEYRRERRSVEEIKERVPEFAEEYKHLFEMITAPEGFDQKNLDLMLSMLGFMGQGRLSQHEASVLVGKRLFEKYGGSFK